MMKCLVGTRWVVSVMEHLLANKTHAFWTSLPAKIAPLCVEPSGVTGVTLWWFGEIVRVTKTGWIGVRHRLTKVVVGTSFAVGIAGMYLLSRSEF